MNEWTAIFVTEQLYRAEFIKNLLLGKGIEAVILNQQDSSFQLGSIEVRVREEDQEKATEIIKSVNCE